MFHFPICSYSISIDSYHKLSVVIIFYVVTDCGKVEQVACIYDPCQTAKCPNIPNAVCLAKKCGQCTAHFYNSSGFDVTDLCSKWDMLIIQLNFVCVCVVCMC